VLAVFSLGLVLGGALSATVLWLLSGLAAPLPSAVRTIAILVIAVLGVLRETGWVRFPMPQNARQIPQDVLQRNVLLGATQFGFELGTGVRTYVSANAPYVVALAIVLSHQGPAAILVGVGFGLGRAVTAAIRLVSRYEEWDDRRLARMPFIVHATGIVVLITLALLLR
jgi:hypothetical protein